MNRVRATVLIVDDHAEFRSSARALLEADGYDVVGDAADGAQAILEVARLKPELVLLDIQLPGEDGIAVAARLMVTENPPVVVLISSRGASEYGPRLAESAASGFISKGSLSGEALASFLG
jgi:DNA-binding NarL/FixJ family response regulator